jgi:hypothetical protein
MAYSLAKKYMPHERALIEAPHMALRSEEHRIASADHKDAHRFGGVGGFHLCPQARRSLRVEPGVENFRAEWHLDFLLVSDLDRVFVYGFHGRLVFREQEG